MAHMARPRKDAQKTADAMASAAGRQDATAERRRVQMEDARRQAERTMARADGWSSLYTGAGLPGRDKTESFEFKARARIEWAQLQNLYRQNWIAKRLVDDVVGDATRSGFEIDFEATDDDAKDDLRSAVKQEWQRLHAIQRCADGLRWAMVFRGSVGLLLTDDIPAGLSQPMQSGTEAFTTLATPLPENDFGAVKQIVIVDARYALPDISRYDDDVDSLNFGLPLYYQVTPYGQSTNTVSYRVHWSRLLRFNGVPTDMLTRIANLTWGDSVYEACFDALRRYGMAFDGVAVTVSEFAQGVLSMKDLSLNLASDQVSSVITRTQAFKMGLGAFGLALIDADAEEYKRLGQPVGGLDSLLEKFKVEIAGASRIPQSRLWGNQAGRLSGAEEDHRLWAEYVHAWQMQSVIPQLHRLTSLIFASKDGPTKGAEPPRWVIRPNPIDPPDLDKEIERRERQAKIDQAYYQMDALEPIEIRESRFGGVSYTYETTLDQTISEQKKEAQAAAATPEPGLPKE
jgi:phage-related protein (TIGR01555 family)